MRVLLLGMLLACAEAAAQAGRVLPATRIFLAPLPADLDAARILERSREGLAAGGWSVDADGAGYVAARRDSARIQLLHVPGVLRYEVLRGSVADEAIAALRAKVRAAVGQAPLGAPTGKPLAGNIPPDADPAQVLEITRVAFGARRWTAAVSDHAVHARIKTYRAEAAMVVFMTGSGLQYAEEGEVPEDWIARLRGDIPRYLQDGLPQASRARRGPGGAEPRQAQGDTGERLRSLKQLFDSGMITREEYEKKRAAILKAI
jgi:hypothetical protein